MIFGIFRFYVILYQFSDLWWFVGDFRKFRFWDFSNCMWFYVHFLILDEFLTILGNFDFGIFPILCDSMSVFWFWMTFWRFRGLLIFGFFPFYVILCQFFDSGWLFDDFRKFWFWDFSHSMWCYVNSLTFNDFLPTLGNFDFRIFLILYDFLLILWF